MNKRVGVNGHSHTYVEEISPISMLMIYVDNTSEMPFSFIALLKHIFKYFINSKTCLCHI